MSKKPPQPTPKEKADLNGVTIMMTAAEFNLIDKIAEYIKAKHNINAVDNAKNNALFYAVNNTKVEAANLLMFHKIDLTQVNLSGELALHIAAEKKMDEVVVRWVQAKGPLDVQDKIDGSTPLMRAIKAGDAYFAIHLIDAGADFEKLKNNQGQNAAQLGISYFEGQDREFFDLALKRRHDAEIKRQADEAKAKQEFRAEVAEAASKVGSDVQAPAKAAFKNKRHSPKT